MTLFAFPNESKEKATAKIKKYAKIHGPNDFELTDTPQSTLYITDEFLKTVKKETFSKLQIKYSLSLHYLSVQFLFQQLRRLQIYNTIGKKKNFYNVWEFMKKSGKKIFDVEIQILSWISLIMATIFVSSIYDNEYSY